MEKILIPRAIGGALHAEWYKTSTPFKDVPLILLLHGFSGDKTEWGRFPKTAQALNTAGMDALYFDFSGSGENPREPIFLSRQIKDLEEVFAWAQSQGYKKITTVGLSFGGLTSLLANLPDRKIAVFWAPAFNLNWIIKRKVTPIGYKLGKWMLKKPERRIKIPNNKLPYPPVEINSAFFDEIENIPIEEKLAQFKIPTLMIQGSKDNAVNPEWSRANFAKFPQDNHHQYIEIQDATHDFEGELLDQFNKETIEWLKKNI